MGPKGTLPFEESTTDVVAELGVGNGASVDDEDEDVVTFGVTEI